MRTKHYTIMTMICGLLCVFGLLGCGTSDQASDLLRLTSSAEAQSGDDKSARTFLSEPDTFVLEADSLPTVEVSDNATFYTLISDGTLRFTESGTGDAKVFDLDNGDSVIERPVSGYVTVVRDKP